HTALDGPGGHNLIGNATECTGLQNGVNGDQLGTPTNPINPGLAALAYYGGGTETEVPLAGSLAIGAGSAAACESEPTFGSDQRGQSRAASSRDACDVGADDTAGTAPPTLSGLSPAAIASGGKKVSVTLTGTGFVSGATLLASNPAITFSKVKVVSSTEITARAIASAAVARGAYDVTVKQPNNAAFCHGCLMVTKPSVSSLSPSSLPQGAHDASVTVNGSGFVGRVKVSFSGASAGLKAKVLSVSATALSLDVSVPASATTGAYSLTLKNGDGSSTTCAGCLTVTTG
ncbi:MAG: filamentous hemagglutinin family N-terminal domain protein, partial [Solirubrobacterales bacterium]|nr:filamentous hemagglutinin family N-terminal domain protein [Solirubrobacterales bacterium]